ncbi:hypothetical protein C8R44DRAFT_728502 [Mycena epipterygia]|nr:hypothetical protein C8R44DRAFT_728502 [Mycena epipterygia]
MTGYCLITGSRASYFPPNPVIPQNPQCNQEVNDPKVHDIDLGLSPSVKRGLDTLHENICWQLLQAHDGGSTISPHAPFVISRSASILLVNITFIPMAISITFGKSFIFKACPLISQVDQQAIRRGSNILILFNVICELASKGSGVLKYAVMIETQIFAVWVTLKRKSEITDRLSSASMLNFYFG